jgi:hypothetical protein
MTQSVKARGAYNNVTSKEGKRQEEDVEDALPDMNKGRPALQLIRPGSAGDADRTSRAR